MSQAAQADNFSSARRIAASLVRDYIGALNADNTDGVLELMSDDVIHDVNQGERRRGRDRYRAFHARMMHHYEERLHDPVVMVSRDGTRAAVEYNVKGVYKVTEQGLPPASEQPYALPGGTFFEIENGRISRITTYLNMTDWLTQIMIEPTF